MDKPLLDSCACPTAETLDFIASWSPDYGLDNAVAFMAKCIPAAGNRVVNSRPGMWVFSIGWSLHGETRVIQAFMRSDLYAVSKARIMSTGSRFMAVAVDHDALMEILLFQEAFMDWAMANQPLFVRLLPKGHALLCNAPFTTVMGDELGEADAVKEG